MTLEELLKAQNLTDEQVTAIIGGMKENKIFTASEENLDIRYGKLKTNHDALVAKDAESQKLIEELQKATKGQDAVQAKITEYEATITRQQEELQQAKTEAALKVGLSLQCIINCDIPGHYRFLFHFRIDHIRHNLWIKYVTIYKCCSFA